MKYLGLLLPMLLAVGLNGCSRGSQVRSAEELARQYHLAIMRMDAEALRRLCYFPPGMSEEDQNFDIGMHLTFFSSGVESVTVVPLEESDKEHFALMLGGVKNTFQPTPTAKLDIKLRGAPILVRKAPVFIGVKDGCYYISTPQKPETP
jgi:hypothetical protein